MDGTEFVNEDYITIAVAFVSVILGVYILGRREADGMWGLGLWDARVFAAFLTFLGLGIAGAWLSNNLEAGNLVDIFGDDSADFANTIGFLTGLALTVAAISASMFDKDAPVPSWARNLVALLGLGILFASGLTITVQSFYNGEFTGEFLMVDMPLFPMNEFLASIWTAGLLSLCGAALLGLIGDAREVVE